MSKNVLMAAVRKASMRYKQSRGMNPKILFLSRQLATVLTGNKYLPIHEESHHSGDFYDNNHCILDIYITPEELGYAFNLVGHLEDYKNAVAEYWLLNSTDSKSIMREGCEKDSSF